MGSALSSRLRSLRSRSALAALGQRRVRCAHRTPAHSRRAAATRPWLPDPCGTSSAQARSGSHDELEHGFGRGGGDSHNLRIPGGQFHHPPTTHHIHTNRKTFTMFTTLTTLTTTLVVTCATLIPGCQPTPKPPCEPGVTITIDYQAETPCDLDGSQQLNEVHNPMLTDESFTTICLDSGGIPVITETKKECDDRDY